MQILRESMDETSLANLEIAVLPGDRIYLHGDLGAGKTTLSRSIIRRYLGDAETEITSPTYTYYKRYGDIWHFDLYRIESYDDFVNIGGEEILDDPRSIVLVEWPEIIAKTYPPTIEIHLTKDSVNPSFRNVRVVRAD